MQNVSVSDPSSNSTILTDLSPGTIYMIRVAGINTRGVGNYSEFGIAQIFTGNTFASVFLFFSGDLFQNISIISTQHYIRECFHHDTLSWNGFPIVMCV